MSAALEEIFARFTTVFDAGPLKRGQGEINSTGVALQRLGRVLLGGAAIAGVTRMIDSVAEMGDHLDKTSQRLGLTAAQFQGLEHAARLSGMENPMEPLQAAVGRLSNMTADSRAKFRRLGIELKGADGKALPLTEVLFNMARAMEGMSVNERAATAIQLIGEQGGRLAPMLAGGEEALRSMVGEVDALGAAFSQDQVKQSAAYEDAMTRLSLAFGGIKAKLALSVIPTLTTFMEAMSKSLGSVARWLADGKNLETLFQSLGIAIGYLSVTNIPALIGALPRLWAAFAPVAIPIAAFVALFLVIDEVNTALNGGDTLMGRWATTVQEELIPSMQEAGGAIGVIADVWKYLIDKVTKFFEWVGGVSDLGTTTDQSARSFRAPTQRAPLSDQGMRDLSRQAVDRMSGEAIAQNRRQEDQLARALGSQPLDRTPPTQTVNVNIAGDVNDTNMPERIGRETQRVLRNAWTQQLENNARGDR